MARHYVPKPLIKELEAEYERYLEEGSPVGYMTKDQYVDVLIAFALRWYLDNAVEKAVKL